MSVPLLLKPLPVEEARLKNPLALAFVGDTVWDLLTRQRLLQSAARVNALHKQAVAQVNAGAQAQASKRIEPMLTPEEWEILRRGQNA
ncbi:MAG: ribonuclease III domain-containing protein, partial [Clostridia bacterium]